MERILDRNSDNRNEDSSETKQPLPSINLPKGGGAIRGIDEKFSVNSLNGTGSTTIPLPLSPGRSGFGPQLSLAYDSGSGNHAFGLGWTLSLPSITRKTDKGLPRYWDHDESDVFILSGAEDLVPLLLQSDVSNELTRHTENQTVDGVVYQVQRYRPRTEGLFARIERWRHSQTGEVHWRSIGSDNITTLYGRTPESRIADAGDPSKIFSWLICETYDDKGNVIVYRYKNEDSSNIDVSQLHEKNRTELSRSTNRYLKRVQYGNRTPYQRGEDIHQRNDWMFEAVFDYGEGHYQAQIESEQRLINASAVEQNTWPVRQDPTSQCRAGFEVRAYRLCRRVLMFHHFSEELDVDDYLVRAVHLHHQERPINTLLTSIVQSSYLHQQNDTFLERSLPAIDHEYSQASIQNTVHDIDDVDNLPSGLSDSSYQWVDLDGEGLSGILKQQGGSLFYKRNSGDGTFDAQIELPSKPSLAAISSGQQLLDLEGDGHLALVILDGSVSGYYERTEDNDWSNYKGFSCLPSIDWSDPNTRFIDLTGDGRADILITEDQAMTWYGSLGNKGYDVGERVSHGEDEEGSPRLVFADINQSVYLADMSGDGLTDIVRICNGSICYWPNLGYGHFGTKVSMGNAPHFDTPDLFNQQRIRLADIDGSGVPDILYIQYDNRAAVYTNQAGNSWANAEYIQHVPSMDKLSSIHLVDLFGNGTACLVWSSPLQNDSGRPMRYIDLMGGQKPYLLVASRNNMGAETRMHYAASTKFYLQDKAAGNPWITQLPFPVQVVERVEVFDHISRNRFTTRYAYHHGYFDGAEREFRGFGMVEQWDTEEFAALTDSGDFPIGNNVDERSHMPPVHTKTWFHTGIYLGRQRVSNFFAGLLDERNTGEYYREPGLSNTQVAQRLLPDTLLPAGLTLDEEREACRTLKGSVLRQEVYALDGSAQEPHPYTVSEQNFTVELLQSKGGNRHAVCFTHTREALSINYERNPTDPRISHALTLSVDNFGNVLQSASIAYGRLQVADPPLSQVDQLRQTQLFVTCAENRFTNAIEEVNDYRTPLPCEVTSFEVTGLELETDQIRFEFSQLTTALQNATQLDYHQSPTSGLQKRLVQQTRNYFRPNDFGEPQNDSEALLPFAQLDSLVLPGESYTLAFTLPHYNAIFTKHIDETLLPNLLRDEGRYVQLEDVNDEQRWWIPSGRIFFSPNENDSAVAERTFAQQHFFLPLRSLDTFGQTSVVSYDQFDLIQLEVRNALNNRITAGERGGDGSIVPRFNYRVLQAELMTDPNGNRSAVAFDVLGLVAGTALMGKASEVIEGDNLEGFQSQLTQTQIDAFFADPRGPIATELLGNASSRIIYDENRFTQNGQPAVAATIVRETHVSELTANEETIVQVSLAYSDGFARVIQSKAQAEPGPVAINDSIVNPRWATSGWSIFNNKGKPVKQFEPFFSASHEFEFGIEVGVSPTLFYDPVGRVAATLHPNHTWEKVVFDQWQQENWDVNDTVLMEPANDPDVGAYFQRVNTSDYLPTWHQARIDGSMGAEEQDAAQKAAAHAQTPGLSHFDSLGRPFLSVANNGPGELFETRTEQDIEGNPLRIIDARGNAVMEYQLLNNGEAISAYDIAGRQLFAYSMDTGASRLLSDISGKPIRSWDARGQRQRPVYDELQRPTHMFVSPINDPLNDIQNEILTDLTLYGENHPDAENLNLRGAAYQVYDGAGVVTSRRISFKGNLLEGDRQLAREYSNSVDWVTLSNLSEFDEIEAAAVSILEDEVFTNRIEYDALNRPISATSPDNSIMLPSYNEANLLEQVQVRLQGAQQANRFVENIDYNAKGQRELITYATIDGTNFTTRYEYDPNTFRLTRLHTQRHRDNSVLQDLNYAYDPAGNITSIRDNAQQTVFFNNAQIEPYNDYTYDAIYRLINAQGREHAAQNSFQRDTADFESIIGIPFANSPQALQRYTEEFSYDGVGNILSMAHRGGDVQQWQRRYQYATDSNRLLATSLPGDLETQFSAPYSYDVHGNMLTMPHLPLMQWDVKDQLQASSRQVINEGTPETTYYVYDASGERVRKVTDRQVTAQQLADRQTPTRLNERIYIGGFEIYREFDSDNETIELERQTLHIMDDQQRIALVDTRTQGNDDSPLQSLRYQLSNHLGSASLELDQQANIISYEEYHAYGTCAYCLGRSQSEISLKRYRYTGMERDEETGLNYHGARYYAAWLGRWTAADPIGIGDGVNLYSYVNGKVVDHVDSTGKAGETKGGVETNIISPTVTDALKNNGYKYAAEVEIEVFMPGGSTVKGRVDRVLIDPQTNRIVLAELKGLNPDALTKNQIEYLSHISENGADVKFTGKNAKKLSLNGVFRINSDDLIIVHSRNVGDFVDALAEQGSGNRIKHVQLTRDGRLKFFNQNETEKFGKSLKAEGIDVNTGQDIKQQKIDEGNSEKKLKAAQDYDKRIKKGKGSKPLKGKFKGKGNVWAKIFIGVAVAGITFAQERNANATAPDAALAATANGLQSANPIANTTDEVLGRTNQGLWGAAYQDLYDNTIGTLMLMGEIAARSAQGQMELSREYSEQGFEEQWINIQSLPK
jgi:RHS repeat-associated protein